MSSNKKTPAVAETMTPEDAIKALISIRDGLKELKAATDQLATILNNLGTLAGLAKDGVIAATAKPAARPPKPAPKKAKPAAKPVAKPPKPAKQPAKEKFLKDLADQQAPKPQAKPTPKPKAEPTDMQTGKKPAPEKKGDDAVRGSSVSRAPHQITLNIGSQPVKELAEQDAKDFLNNHKVFWYQAIRFPDPKRYGVQPRILSAKVVERRNPKFTRAPWTVSVTVEALGDDKKCESWLTGVLTKNKADQE